MACLTASPLKFTVHRHPAVLMAPAAATPHELKRLSDIDDQDGLRALVQYYPFAGRLRELEGRKLAVDCTAESVLFIEADADVCLEHFGEVVHPPFPAIEELLFEVPGSSATLNCPLVLFQCIVVFRAPATRTGRLCALQACPYLCSMHAFACAPSCDLRL
ncbi:hypothetical protein PR202_ga25332 [Eleusine coracana subsp. coracana]|uniref:Uncharacterized protein n=1 Tax=Eleusine coracana subsp. coracana TaxID=191504 RepID=A0AAV5DB05_ELECO|nr:hypothetical protein PR202_ga25332 [Eleusine coracana subsp. coracana]